MVRWVLAKWQPLHIFLAIASCLRVMKITLTLNGQCECPCAPESNPVWFESNVLFITDAQPHFSNLKRKQTQKAAKDVYQPAWTPGLISEQEKTA